MFVQSFHYKCQFKKFYLLTVKYNKKVSWDKKYGFFFLSAYMGKIREEETKLYGPN